MSGSGSSAARRIALDTSAYSRFRAGNAAVLDRVAAADVVYLSAIVLGELEAGFLLGRRTEENRVMLAEFLREEFVAVVPASPEIARRYGAIFAQLRRARTPVPVNDIWIAATAMESGAHLLTFDTDFIRIAGLDRTVLDA